MAPQKDISPSPSGADQQRIPHEYIKTYERNAGLHNWTSRPSRGREEKPCCLGSSSLYHNYHLDTDLLAAIVIIQQRKDELPCSGRPGMVRAPSLPTFDLISSVALPAWTFWGSGGCATIRSSLLAAISSPSRLFHVARTSADGAHPRMPGWIRPANLTCGMCLLKINGPTLYLFRRRIKTHLEEHEMPDRNLLEKNSKSQLTGYIRTCLQSPI